MTNNRVSQLGLVSNEQTEDVNSNSSSDATNQPDPVIVYETDPEERRGPIVSFQIARRPVMQRSMSLGTRRSSLELEMNSYPNTPRILGADNQAFTYPTDGLVQDDNKETVVSFVIKDAEKGHQDVTSGPGSEESGQWTVMLSTLYAVILILTGVAFPLYEALQHQWLNSHEIGIFLTYLFLGSTIFLIYLQINIAMQSKKEAKERCADEPVVSSSSPEATAPSSGMNTPKEEGEDKPIPKDMLLLRLRKLTPSGPGSRPASLAGSRPESPTGSQMNLDRISISEEANKMRMNSRNSRNSLPAVMNLLGADGRRKPSLPNLELSPADCASAFKQINQMTSADSCPETPRNELSTVEENDAFYDEDRVYEQFVLMEQTATLTHEGASFYLRLGCLLFGIANFVFVSVEIHAYLTSGPKCDSKALIYPYCFQLLFLLVQTFFVFKHTHVHVRRSKGLIRFGLLHVLATNLCIWLRVLTKEVVEAFEKQHSSGHDDTDPHAYPSYSGYAGDGHGGNGSDGCNTEFVHQLSPYLFPFVLEYSLIVVAVMASIFHGLNLRITTDLFASLQRALRTHPEKLEDNSDSLHHESFFSKSHRGLYLGVILLSATIVSIILFFYSIGTSGKSDNAVQIYYCTDSLISVLLIIGLVVGFHQLRGLHVTFNRDNTIDNVLLMVSMSGLILLQIFILIAAVSTLTAGDYDAHNQTTTALQIATCVINIAQGLIQTTFVMDGLQRCAPTKVHRDQKPGRGVVTFLVIANLALWIYKTFQVKELSMTNLEDVYGPIAWPLILNVSLPLLLFYHFHSSVCLADVWYSAYEMETGPKYRTL